MYPSSVWANDAGSSFTIARHQWEPVATDHRLTAVAGALRRYPFVGNREGVRRMAGQRHHGRWPFHRVNAEGAAEAAPKRRRRIRLGLHRVLDDGCAESRGNRGSRGREASPIRAARTWTCAQDRTGRGASSAGPRFPLVVEEQPVVAHRRPELLMIADRAADDEDCRAGRCCVFRDPQHLLEDPHLRRNGRNRCTGYSPRDQKGISRSGPRYARSSAPTAAACSAPAAGAGRRHRVVAMVQTTCSRRRRRRG